MKQPSWALKSKQEISIEGRTCPYYYHHKINTRVPGTILSNFIYFTFCSPHNKTEPEQGMRVQACSLSTWELETRGSKSSKSDMMILARWRQEDSSPALATEGV